MPPALVLAALLALAGCGAPSVPAPVVSPPAGAASSYVPPPVEVAESNPPTANDDGDLLRFGDGDWVAGAGVAPGYYRSAGRAAARPLCSWSVSSEPDPRAGKSSGGSGVTIAAGVSTLEDDPQRVALLDGQQLTTRGCATWVYYGP